MRICGWIRTKKYLTFFFPPRVTKVVGKDLGGHDRHGGRGVGYMEGRGHGGKETCVKL